MPFMSDYAKCLVENESNISVRKKIIHSGKKRLKSQGDFSGLENCVEATVSVDDQYDSDDVPEKRKKMLKIGKSGNSETGKENKNVEKNKFNSNLNLDSGKMNERIKRTFSVSSSEEMSDPFAFSFEDFGNSDIVATPNNFQKNFQIANTLKYLFPNPFELTKIPEFNKSKISMYIEKIVRVDVTLPDVVISESDSQKMLHSTRVRKIFEADYDKNSCQMDSRALNSTTSIKNRRPKTSEGTRSSNTSDDLATNAKPVIYKSLGSCRRNTPPSKQSSYENISDRDLFRTEGTRVQETTNFFKAGRSRTPKNSKQQFVDYDIGKFQLLTVSESEDSSKDLVRRRGTVFRDDFGSRNDITDTSRDDKFRFFPNVVKESEMVQEILNELSQKHKVNQTEVRSRSISDGRDRRILGKAKAKYRKAVKNLTAGDGPKVVEDNFDDNKEGNLKMSEMTEAGKREEEESESEEKMPQVDDREMVEASEKIDEVLKFMSDCLKKLTNDEVAGKGNSIKETVDVEKVRDENRRNLVSDCTEDLPTAERLDVPETSIQSANGRRRTTSAINQSDNAFQLVELEQSADRETNETDTVYPDSREINNENAIHIVEIQNELGGYAEEQQRVESSVRNSRLSKSVLPLSVKINKSNTNTHKVLRNALEREERLLNEYPPRSGFLENSLEIQAEESQSSCSPTDAFKSHHSNFVICLNSMPRKMRANSLTGFSFCPRAISFDGVQTPEIQSLSHYQKLHLEMKLNEIDSVTENASKVGVLFIMHKSTATYITTAIGVSFIMESSKMEDEILLKNSENFIIRKFRSEKKSVHVNPSIPPITIHCAAEIFKKLDFPSELHEQVEALEEAVEQTEKMYFLEQNRNETFTASEGDSLSRNKTYKTAYNRRSDEGRIKRKLQDLLLRTHNLQQKLCRRLATLTAKPLSASCSSLLKDSPSDLGVACRSSEIFRIIKKSSEEWSRQKAQKSNASEKTSKLAFEKIDCSTSYEPPPLENFEEIENRDRDDDQSSTDSFKSSNNFSEGERELTMQKLERTAKQALNNVCNEMEIFQRKIPSKKEGKTEINIKSENFPEISECLKTPSKLLKTVFKGKDSLTELSLGLKAVPLDEVSNISVEKKKISENHTKISICISKEKVKTLPQKRRDDESKEMMNSRLSHYLDNIKTSKTSDCGQHSGLENNIYAPETDEEDDFKSVVSTLSRPNSETNMPKEAKEVKRLEIIPPKSLTKHRFDFYKKMETPNQIRQKSMSNTSCTYKEFEPLNQALTEVQLRMRSIKRDSYFRSNDYYQKALKLAKMSAGYCQNCRANSIIPQDNFGYYNTLLPRNQSQCHRTLHVNPVPLHSGYYSITDMDLERTPSYWLNSSRSIIRNPVYDFPTYSTLT